MLPQIVKRLLPGSLRPPLRTLYGAARSNLEFLMQGVRDRITGVADTYAPFKLPPPRLRYRVHVSVDPDSFVNVARVDAGMIVAAAERHGCPLAACERVLDWGCGPGKVLQGIHLHHLKGNAPAARPKLHGTDLSPGSIRWATRNLPFATFSVNDPMPPLPFAPESFDLIYGISVFSHLDQRLEGLWLNELHRLVRPTGLVIVTVRGSYASDMAIASDSDEGKRLEQVGIVFRPPPATDYRKEGLPDCYGNTYHTKEYITKAYSRQFTILEHTERGLRGSQDLLVLRKRP
jgi:SAM-dependent methyltransferase